MDTNIYDYYETINSKEDFERFLKLLVEDFEKNKDNWENDTLSLFLESLYGFNYDSKSDPVEIKPTWKEFAKMLLAAKVYE